MVKKNTKACCLLTLWISICTGHRNNVEIALIEFDNRLPEIIAQLKDDDILLITAIMDVIHNE